jgi:hypothetical protein
MSAGPGLNSSRSMSRHGGGVPHIPPTLGQNTCLHHLSGLHKGHDGVEEAVRQGAQRVRLIINQAAANVSRVRFLVASTSMDYGSLVRCISSLKDRTRHTKIKQTNTHFIFTEGDKAKYGEVMHYQAVYDGKISMQS